MAEPDGEVLTEQEAAVYDRQIRVWGVDAQRRLSKARVLVVGITGVIAETCKNIVLAGIGVLTLMDDTPVSLEAATSNFLIYVDEIATVSKSVAAVCAEALGDYNPMVRVGVEEGCIEDKPAEFFDNFDAVILGRPSITLKKHVNSVCRSRPQRLAFYSVDCRGSCGGFFVDLQSCTYPSQRKGNKKDTQITKKFASLEDALLVRWDSLPKKISKLYFAMRMGLQGNMKREYDPGSVLLIKNVHIQTSWKLIVRSTPQVVEEFEQREQLQQRHLTSKDLPALLSFGSEILQAQGMSMSIGVENLLKRISDAGTSELSPVCAILGGVLGQEVLKALSCKGEPIKNHFFFDSVDGKGVIEDVSPSEGRPLKRHFVNDFDGKGIQDLSP